MKRRNKPLELSSAAFLSYDEENALERNREMIARSNLKDGKLPENVCVEWDSIGGVRAAHMIRQSSPEGKLMLHIHGGGWISGVPCTGQRAFAEIVDETCVDLYSVDYRLAPEHPYPAALEDCIAVYTGLLAMGYKSDNIVLIGESAGGNLCLSLGLYLKDNGIPLPGGMALISPAGLLREPLQGEAAMYVGNADCTDPYISPQNGDFRGFPPVLLQFGGSEFLKRDGAELTYRLMRAGVDTLAHAWEFMPHVFVLMQDEIPEAGPAKREIAEFVKRILEV